MKYQRVFDTKNHSREEWLAARMKGIGASDASASIGMSRYKCQIELYQEKMGILEGFTGNEATAIGLEIEDTIAELFKKRTGIGFKEPDGNKVGDLRRSNFIIQSIEYPWMFANLDREGTLPDGRRFVLEIKNAGEYMKDSWEGGCVPDDYLIQLMHQLIVTGYPVGIFGVLLGGNKLRILVLDRDLQKDLTDDWEAGSNFQFEPDASFEKNHFVVRDLMEYGGVTYLKADDDFFDLIIDNERDFMHYIEKAQELTEGITNKNTYRDIVLENIPPVMGSIAEHAFLRENLPENKTAVYVECGEDMTDILDRLQNVKETIKKSQEAKLELEALVYDKIGENEGLQTDKWKVSWKQQNSSGFKSEKFKEEEPEIYRKYTVKVPILDKKLLQQEQQEVYERYKTKTRVLRLRRIKK